MKTAIFDYTDYKSFLLDFIEQMPRRGYGQLRKIAEHIGVNSVVMSQVLRADKDFSLEQASGIADYLGLTADETDYFYQLILLARAGTSKLKQHFKTRIQKQRRESQKGKNKFIPHKELSDEFKGRFYSDWIYSGVQLLTALDEFRTPEEIAQRLKLSRLKVADALEFLVASGLCTKESGRYKSSETSTFLDSNSPYVMAHHRNWRLKALDHCREPVDTDLFFSSSYILAASDISEIRRKILDLIGDVSKSILESKDETVACLNIDWFKF
jgi:uncharacterized protein (TIGR02147 family)